MRHFPELSTIAVLLPESFRGGCSFGVGLTDLSRDCPANVRSFMKAMQYKLYEIAA
jgi:hypothetical protein